MTRATAKVSLTKDAESYGVYEGSTANRVIIV